MTRPATARPSPARRWWPVAAALLAVALCGGLVACSGAASAQTGDCVESTGETSYAPVDCADAPLRVLERIDGADADCARVAGVTESFTDYDGDFSLCLGPPDTDPATAVNVAAVGDCLSGVDPGSGTGEARRVDCADPGAEAQVITREEDVFPVGFECDDVPGSTGSYSWALDQTSSSGVITSNIGVTDVLLCVGPAGVDPQTSPDAARAGDCLRETGDEVGYAKVDCGAPDAGYRVVERVDGGFLPAEVACRSVAGAESGIGRSGLEGYVLCLAPN
ncbi:LppU/SCO3897 family protein [Pseudonocardia humida]|uniref:Regulator of septum formation n=1 Tax=Pseudonocardia humida TaxID=2800819 RepID=A0ABT0ZXU4_9PSEU|nr:hypothetical protein [Pseudonocardia humida]MCO1655569.1 hypothetical protein [Pseudonocardia humida]